MLTRQTIPEINSLSFFQDARAVFRHSLSQKKLREGMPSPIGETLGILDRGIVLMLVNLV
jgi:hypothetical protein